MYRHGNIADYLFSVDPSGQSLWGYCWDRSDGSRPDNIYDDVYKDPNGFIKNVRTPAYLTPLKIHGPGYDMLGQSTTLETNIRHDVFPSGLPVINFNSFPNRGYDGYVDLRYDQFENVYRFPYRTMPVTISRVPPDNATHAFGPSGNTIEYVSKPFKDIAVFNKQAFDYLCKPYNCSGMEFPLCDSLLLRSFFNEFDKKPLQVGEVVLASMDVDSLLGPTSTTNYSVIRPIIFTGRSLPNRFDDNITYSESFFTRIASKQNIPQIQLKGPSGLAIGYTSFRNNTATIASYKIDNNTQQKDLLAYYISRIYGTLYFYETAYLLPRTPFLLLDPYASGNYYHNTVSGEILNEKNFIGYDMNARVSLDILGADPVVPLPGCRFVSREDIPHTIGKDIYDRLKISPYDCLYSYGKFIDRARNSIVEINKKRFPHINSMATGDVSSWLWAKYPSRWNRPTTIHSPLSPVSSIIDVGYNTWLEPLNELGDLRKERDRIISSNAASGFWYHGPDSLSVLDRTLDEVIPLNMENPTFSFKASQGPWEYGTVFVADDLVTHIIPTNTTTTVTGSCTSPFIFSVPGNVAHIVGCTVVGGVEATTIVSQSPSSAAGAAPDFSSRQRILNYDLTSLSNPTNTTCTLQIFETGFSKFSMGRLKYESKGCLFIPGTIGPIGFIAGQHQQSNLSVTAIHRDKAEIRISFESYFSIADDPIPFPYEADVIDYHYTTLRSALADYYNIPTDEILSVKLRWDITPIPHYAGAHVVDHLSPFGPFSCGTTKLEFIPNSLPSIAVTLEGGSIAHTMSLAFSEIELSDLILDKQIVRDFYMTIIYEYTETQGSPIVPPDPGPCGDIRDLCGSPSDLMVWNGWNELVTFSNPRFVINQ